MEILNSKVHRQLDHEYTQDYEPDPETESRHEELRAELDYRATGGNESPTDGRDAQESSIQEPQDTATA
ncbi:hypothetical protein [Arthrobacter sp. H20]|uniref:hypothetical protein n=1 Tax=Arthrobacter sp. H20 TaxID=1267981 RepID=UPI0004B90262|nr:hypothetical protein [Arthrobacter sp. H20]